MIKFTDIAKGDEPGVDKINKNFDMVEQALNLEERKEIPIPLSSGWKVVNDNSLKLVITPGRAWLYGEIGGTSGSSAPYGYNNPIAMAVPTSTTFRNKKYNLKGVYCLCPIGGYGGNTEFSAVRVVCDNSGRVYIEEPSDKVKNGRVTLNMQVDLIEA